MKVTQTKTTTTLYDTNGKQISVVRKEKTVIEAPILLNKKDGELTHQVAETLKRDLENAKAIKKNLEETNGFNKGRRIFNSMVDLLIVVHIPLKTKKSTELDSVLKAAQIDYTTDVKIGGCNKTKQSKQR